MKNYSVVFTSGMSRGPVQLLNTDQAGEQTRSGGQSCGESQTYTQTGWNTSVRGLYYNELFLWEISSLYDCFVKNKYIFS